MDKYQREAALLRAVAHPVRLHIIDLLRAEPQCVCHLSAALDKSQPYVSQQLAILRNAGVIVDEREGTNIFYRLVEANLARQVAAARQDVVAADGNGHRMAAVVLNGCNCPKCSTAREQGVEAHRVKR